MDSFPISFILVLIFFLASKLYNDRALRILNVEQKAQLIDLFQKKRTYNMIVIIIITAVYFTALSYLPEYVFQEIVAFISLILLYILYNAYQTTRILKVNHFPNEFIENYQVGTLIRSAGIIVYFVITTYEFF